jgi:hypothetical protein
MSTFKSKLSAGLAALALSSVIVVSGVATATPAQAHGWGHHHHWRFGYGGYYPAYYGYLRLWRMLCEEDCLPLSRCHHQEGLLLRQSRW